MEVWIGMVGVHPAPGNQTLGTALGAYVNVLALASNQSEYEETVRAALQNLDLIPYEFEDIEKFSERAKKRLLDEDLHTLAAEVRISEEVRFGAFHTYAKTDA